MRNTLSTALAPKRGSGADRSPVARLRTRRRPARALVTGMATLGAAMLIHAARPTPAEAVDLYSTCTDLVGDFYSDCSGSADGRLARYACMWTAGLGYAGCAVVGAVEKFGVQVMFKII